MKENHLDNKRKPGENLPCNYPLEEEEGKREEKGPKENKEREKKKKGRPTVKFYFQAPYTQKEMERGRRKKRGKRKEGRCSPSSSSSKREKRKGKRASIRGPDPGGEKKKKEKKEARARRLHFSNACRHREKGDRGKKREEKKRGVWSNSGRGRGGRGGV